MTMKQVYSECTLFIQEVTILEITDVDLKAADVEGFKKLFTMIWDYFTAPELWEFIYLASIESILIMIVSWLVSTFGKKIIAKVFALRMKTPLSYSERRQKTILKLLQNILSYLVYFSAIIGILSAFDIQVAGLLAGAGIASVAIAFGAQSLVKDIISGFFIVFEDQFGVGDYIKLNTTEGTVYEIGLRTTKIKGTTGEQHIIPNGSIGTVINYSVNDTSTTIDFIVPTTAKIEEVEKDVKKYLSTLTSQYKELTKTPLLMGIQTFTPEAVTMRIKIETVSMQHNNMARIIKKDLLGLLEKYGVTMEQ